MKIELKDIAGILIGMIGLGYGIYQKMRAKRVIARGDAPFLKLQEIILKGAKEKDDNWGTTEREKTVVESKEGDVWSMGVVPEVYKKNWPIVYRCKNIGVKVRSLEIIEKPSGFRIETEEDGLLDTGDYALEIHFRYEPKSYPIEQKFAFKFETYNGRVGFQRYKFNRIYGELIRIEAK